MKTHLRFLLILCALAALGVVVFLLAAPAVVGESASKVFPPDPESQSTEALAPNRVEQSEPVIFPPDPDWPQYAQREITVDPEPPIPGQPTEVCAWVFNTTDVVQTVTLEFGVANFGIGLDFMPIGARTIEVPPFGKARACVIWIPRQPGHWCIQALLKQDVQYPALKSQRNLDVWEFFMPGVPADTVFPVRNPATFTDTIEMRALNIMRGWNAFFTTPMLPLMGPGETRMVTLTVIPPQGTVVPPFDVLFGSREPIVDVEAWSNGGQGELIGGFRKLDTPPVPLHRLKDPPYAETEISIEPERPLPGEPTHLCVELRNLSGVTQTVDVGFQWANFGIGLPWGPAGGRVETIPPHSRTKVCVTWVPPEPGHYCIMVLLDLFSPDGKPLPYMRQWSQRNIDVHEVLKPRLPDHKVFEVGNWPGPNNPTPVTTTIFLTTTYRDSFFDVFLSEDVLRDMKPNESRPVTLTVIPRMDKMPEDGRVVVDVEAYLNALPPQGKLLGGFRKVFRPPIAIHPPHEPPYSESEISVRPYPPRAGEPVVICTELRNPTNMTQTVHVEFGVANFGIGLPFVPIDLQVVEIPPHGKVRVCTTWVPPIGGHFCVQIRLTDPQRIYVDQFSQRNMDVAEYLRRGEPDTYAFPVGHPFNYPVTITLGLVEHLPGWQVQLSTYELRNVLPDTHRVVTMTVTPDASIADLEAGAPVVDVEAYVDHQLIGGFRKEFHPPIPIHRPEDPPYAEREISIEPYPPRANEPTEICVELRNPTDHEQTVWVEFAWANFGIGLPWNPFHGQRVTLPPHSLIKKCTRWVPPFPGHFCVQVTLKDPQQRYRELSSQRNIDVGEVFERGQWTKPFRFLVGNPDPITRTIELAAFVHLEGWEARLEPRLLQDVGPDATREVTLTVYVPEFGPLPPDDTPIVDVEAHAVGAEVQGHIIGGHLIGGFRKIFRPPVPIHRPQDPVYAESEIHINPYPPREREPTEICVDVRNPTDVTQTITVTFAVANFGIGLPFHDIVRPIAVTLPPNSIKQVCITWVPPFGGHFCARVTLQMGDHQPVWSQRNMDVGEILIPGVPSHLPFPVGNPRDYAVTVTLGMVPHLDGWQLSLSQDVLPNMKAHETRVVTLTVTPPQNVPEPEDGAPVVDVEGFIGRELIGGFRKIYHPPVPIHRPRDPVYAESEIFVDPYPTRIGLPTLLGAFVFNPTPAFQRVTVTFSVAHFGIGMPFTTTGIVSPTAVLTIPPFGVARAKTIWIPHLNGHFCVQVTLESAGHEPVWSQRNIDVGEPLRLGEPHSRIIEVRNSLTEVVTITLALVNHRPGWTVGITPTVLTAVSPTVVQTATLTVTPPEPAADPVERDRQIKGLADERPIVDVEAYVNGELIGGIRKIAKPPIPLHKLHEQPYAETEISVTPYPIVAGLPHTITTEIYNTSEETTQTIRVLFGVANFGFGIPFTNTNIKPTYRVVTLGPGLSQTVSAVWTPPSPGDWCIRIILQDPNNQYPEQTSQRNVHVERRPYIPCQPFTKDFRIDNDTPFSVTVTIGASAINLPEGWTYSTNITQTEIGGYGFVTVTVTITPACGLAAQALMASVNGLDTGGASGPPTIDVAGYDDSGTLLGGVQIQLEGAVLPNAVYLPIVLR